MWKLLILVLAGYIVYRMFMNDRKKQSENSEKEKDQLIASGEMVKDPVCGAYIDADSAITVRDGDTVHRFCSYECRDQFLKRIGKLPEKTSVEPDA